MACPCIGMKKKKKSKCEEQENNTSLYDDDDDDDELPWAIQLKPKPDIRDLWPSKPPDDPNQFDGDSTSFWTKSNLIKDLRTNDFHNFLASKDAALVMFYLADLPGCIFAKYQMEQAAASTVRDNHAYAGVNCEYERDLCNQEKCPRMPFFKLYSKGHVVGTFQNYNIFTANEMKNFMESSPVLEHPRMPFTAPRRCEQS